MRDVNQVLYDKLKVAIRFSKPFYVADVLLQFSGDFVGRVTPVPIPNTEVKPTGADGTAL